MNSTSADNDIRRSGGAAAAPYEYSSDSVLMEPYYYLLQVPGKQIRSLLINAFNRWLKVDESVTIAVSSIVQMLHTASLLIDDIEDHSRLRRGIPVTHLIYGEPATINCANYVYFKAMEECTRLGNPIATQVFLEEMLRLHHGQGYDIFWRDSNTCPTEDDYIKMVIDKTGGLFRLGIKMMQAFSDNKTDYVTLVNLLGVFFQIRDDWMNLSDENYMQSKSFYEDLTEGKFSFPIIHCITTNPTDRRLINILKQRTEDVDLKKYAVDYMIAMGSLEYTQKKLQALHAQIIAEIQRLGGNPDLEAFVEALSKFESKSQSSTRPQPALRLSTEQTNESS